MRRFSLLAALLLAVFPALAATDTAAIKRGEYLARAGDCIACHARPGTTSMSGGRGFETPVGMIYATNITPDKQTGIGLYSYAEFAKAVRAGIRRDGAPLYPAMPYPSYARISEADMQDLYAYFMQGIPAVRQENRKVDIPWPFSMRWPLHLWIRAFAPKPQAYVADPGQDARWNRGAYLVQGLAHCGACHTPRGIAYQEKALTEKDGKDFLAGASVDGWFANSLRNDGIAGVTPLRKDGSSSGRSWTQDDFIVFLKTGRNNHSAAFGAMVDVVEHSMQYLRTDDVEAIAYYLSTFNGGRAASPATVTAPVASATAAKTQTSTADLAAGLYRSAGAVSYMEHCAACHRKDGEGVERIFPALTSSQSVLNRSADALIRIVLQGGRMPVTQHDQIALAMPALATLSDQEIADVLSFVRSSWGNQAPQVRVSDVSRVRKTLVPAAKP